MTLPLQLITNGSLLEQGTTPLVALTAIQAGFVVALFWALLANAIVATQVVEDGTLSSLVVRTPFLRRRYRNASFGIADFKWFNRCYLMTPIFPLSVPIESLLNILPLYSPSSLWQ